LGLSTRGGGDAAGGGHGAQRADGLAGAGDQRLVELDGHAGFGGGVVDHPAVTGVAVGAQHQCLGAKLDAVRLPSALGQVGGAAALVIHRRDDSSLGLDQVNAGGEAFFLGAQPD